VQCVGCHSVSANGARIVAQRSEAAADVAALVINPGVSPITSVSYQLGIDGKTDPAAGKISVGSMGAYGALYPDGSKFLTSSGQVTLAGSASFLPRRRRPRSSTYHAAQSSPTPGIPPGAAMPMFSPDGKHLVSNDDRRAVELPACIRVAFEPCRTSHRQLCGAPKRCPQAPPGPAHLWMLAGAVQVAELDTAETLADRLLTAVGNREQGPAVVAESAAIRQRAFTLFLQAYDDARRAVAYLRWRREDAATIAPSLYAGRGTGRRKAAPQPEPPPATHGGGSVAAPAVQPNTVPVDEAPHGLGMPGGSPFTTT
jgi:hypothetical protein